MRLLCEGTLTGNDHLPRRIEVHRFHHAALRGFGTGRFDIRVLEPEQCRHRASAQWHGFLHDLAAKTHQLHAGGKIDGLGGHQCGELSEAVARHDAWHGTTAFVPQAPGRNARGEHGWLGPLGGVQILDGSLLAQLPQVIAQNFRRLIEGRANAGRFAGQFGHHANGLGTLAGEHKRK